MTLEAQVAEVVRLWIALLSLCGLLFWLVRDYRTDSLRQQLFDLRNRLFDDAASGLISFDHPVYGLMRVTINCYIRFAHQINLVTLIISVVARRLHLLRTSANLHTLIDEACASLPDERARQRISQTHSELSRIIFRHVSYGRLLAVPLRVLVFVTGVVQFRRIEDQRSPVKEYSERTCEEPSKTEFEQFREQVVVRFIEPDAQANASDEELEMVGLASRTG